MSRRAREKSNTGIYHVMVRGVSQQNIFTDDDDRLRYIETLERFKKEMKFAIYAYCLMDNHIHLILNQKDNELSNIMKKIGTSYVYYYNWKYERMGHLFQDRYKSEAVEDDSYFFTVVRYVHQNPVKAGICDIQSYKWCSNTNYLKDQEMIDTDFLLGMLSADRNKALELYISYMNEVSNDQCLEIEKHTKFSDGKVRDIIISIGALKNISEIRKLEVEKRNEILRTAKELEGISVLQISRVTGINRITVIKA